MVFFVPTFGGLFMESPNFEPANPVSTPEHIAPVWYFTPFYAMLRMIPAKLPGVIVMFLGIVLLFFMPWLDRGVVKSVRYRGLGYKIALALFAISFVMLGAVGAGITAEKIPEWFGPEANVTTIENAFGRFWLIVYFAFFAFLMFYTWLGKEKTKRVPDRVTTHA